MPDISEKDIRQARKFFRRSGLFRLKFFNKVLDAEQGVNCDSLDDAIRFSLSHPDQGKMNYLFDNKWYCEQLTAAGETLNGKSTLQHYVEIGEDAGLSPSPFFDSKWYRETYSDWQVQDTDFKTALGHFFSRVKDKSYTSPCKYIDPHFYRRVYLDIEQSVSDPVRHYLFHGDIEGRRPSYEFDPAFYRYAYMDKSEANDAAFNHYIRQGRAMGHEPCREAVPAKVLIEQADHYTAPGPDFEEIDHSLANLPPSDVECIAYYLPQYHRLPENDKWWGQGFTEWRNVTRGKPRYVGHYQPHLPRDLGYYDLTTPGVMAQQIDLAKLAGVSCFGFYYYNFGQQRILEKPLDAFLADETLDQKFCLIWANENWSRTWDGGAQLTLREQSYAEDQIPSIAADMVKYIRDDRYLRVDGKPLIICYRADAPAHPARYYTRLREAICAEIREDIQLIGVQSFGFMDPRVAGMDGAIEFPPHKFTSLVDNMSGALDLTDPGYVGRSFSYEAAVDAAQNMAPVTYPLIRCAVPAWDNEPRRPGAGLDFHGSSPELYARWLQNNVTYARENPVGSTPLIAINAWNEWAEGAHLEPDVYYGAAYLNATGRVLRGGHSDG
ncbi:glycosyltransferase WbsX family protein [Halocynthiibacter styelae]|uniref:Glycoside hydrolase family 99-like domain-containing protein n=1 Tax=Halocynthiibacter styelae TaxID=2761955 RepID=A0A8J7IKW8_9RHOB|nr:glycoside hydrolase family 99-like domain-containing protein [Paenihalocynthiibacter styelae]MBI1495083.1 glycoside hydrolase family 99-like domain-containing protein [Paenihalocynthiibacter styelae]